MKYAHTWGVVIIPSELKIKDSNQRKSITVEIEKLKILFN